MFEQFAIDLAERFDRHLVDEGPEEQAVRMVERLERFSKGIPLTPVHDRVIDLAGFGEVPAHFESAEDPYVLISEVAEQLGWPLHKAHEWAKREHGFAIRDQRDADEERGDGRLGWECMGGYVDLGLSLVLEDPEAKPDSNGRSWSFAGDWLISHDRLPLLLSCSPWGKEFMDNVMPHFNHVARKVWGDQLKGVPTYGADGQPTGGNAFEDLFRTDGLSEEEALRRARRGLSLDFD